MKSKNFKGFSADAAGNRKLRLYAGLLCSLGIKCRVNICTNSGIHSCIANPILIWGSYVRNPMSVAEIKSTDWAAKANRLMVRNWEVAQENMNFWFAR